MKYTDKEKKYKAWFDSEGFRNFGAHEFIRISRNVRGSVRNSLPPAYLYRKIVPSLRIVDDLRDHFSAPVRVVSAYRSEAYNKACGGASRSQHKKHVALDIQVKGVSPKRVYKLLLKWRQEGRFKGGLGLYSTFVHIDTRGYNATWGKR